MGRVQHGAGLALCLSLLLGDAVVHASGHGIDEGDSSSNRTVCVMAYSVIDVCGTDGTLDFTGYEPELFKQVAHYMMSIGHLEWAPGNWSFQCFLDSSTSFDTIIEALNNGTCDVAMGGVVLDEVVGKNVELSYSTHPTGRRIMMYRAYPPALWAFLRPMSYGVWILAFFAAVVVALAVLLLDASWSVQPGSAAPCWSASGSRAGFKHLTWDTIWRGYSSVQWSTIGVMLLSVNQLSPRSPGARIVVAGFAFTSLLLFCMYTAASSAAITIGVQRADVADVEDLQRLAVGIWEGDVDALSEFALDDVYRLVWNTDADGEEMIQDLRLGKLDALILDDPFVQYQTSQHCDLFAVGSILKQAHMVYMFPTTYTETYLEHFDLALQTLENNTIMDQLWNKYVHITDLCPELPPMTSFTQVSLHEIGGLWIILASCLGVGLLWNILQQLAPHMRPNADAGDRGGGSSSMVASHLPSSPKHSASNGSVTLRPVPEAHESTLQEPEAEATPQALGWPQSTVGDRLLTLSTRLDKLEALMLQLPNVMGACMDRELRTLRGEMARVITGQMRRKEASRQASATGGRPFPRDGHRAVTASSSSRQLRPVNHFPGVRSTTRDHSAPLGAVPTRGTASLLGGPRMSAVLPPELMTRVPCSGDAAQHSSSAGAGPSSSSGPSARCSAGDVPAARPLSRNALELAALGAGGSLMQSQRVAAAGSSGSGGLAASNGMPSASLAPVAEDALRHSGGGRPHRLISSVSHVQEVQPDHALVVAAQLNSTEADVAAMTKAMVDDASCGAHLPPQEDPEGQPGSRHAGAPQSGTRLVGDAPPVLERNVSGSSARKLSEPPGAWLRHIGGEDASPEAAAQSLVGEIHPNSQASSTEESLQQLQEWAEAAGVQLNLELVTSVQQEQLKQLAKLVAHKPPADLDGDGEAGCSEGQEDVRSALVHAAAVPTGEDARAPVAASSMPAAVASPLTAVGATPPSAAAAALGMPAAPAPGSGPGASTAPHGASAGPGVPAPSAAADASAEALSPAVLDAVGTPWAAAPIGCDPAPTSEVQLQLQAKGSAAGPTAAATAARTWQLPEPASLLPDGATPLPGLAASLHPNVGIGPLQPVTDTYYMDDGWYEDDGLSEDEEEEPQSYEIP